MGQREKIQAGSWQMVQCKLEGWYFDDTSILWASCIINTAVLPWGLCVACHTLGQASIQRKSSTRTYFVYRAKRWGSEQPPAQVTASQNRALCLLSIPCMVSQVPLQHPTLVQASVYPRHTSEL